jgi:hypothetical protein
MATKINTKSMSRNIDTLVAQRERWRRETTMNTSDRLFGSWSAVTNEPHPDDCDCAVCEKANRAMYDPATDRWIDPVCQFCNDTGVTPEQKVCKRCYTYARTPAAVRLALLGKEV